MSPQLNITSGNPEMLKAMLRVADLQVTHSLSLMAADHHFRRGCEFAFILCVLNQKTQEAILGIQEG